MVKHHWPAPEGDWDRSASGDTQMSVTPWPFQTLAVQQSPRTNEPPAEAACREEKDHLTG